MEGYGFEPAYYSDRVPVRAQTTVEGHAVRAVYLGARAADVSTELGDTELLNGTDVAVTAVPYFAWANRGIGPMRVWLPPA